VRLILGVDAEKRVQQAEAARAAEADKWRHLTVSTVLKMGASTADCIRQIAETIPELLNPERNTIMKYRLLGKSGLRVSEASWHMTFATSGDGDHKD